MRINFRLLPLLTKLLFRFATTPKADRKLIEIQIIDITQCVIGQ
ncbi:MAG: hypothetical protein OXU23_00735 [Candidatus Poribacteria bacterium]|nr:hypothetical protein [Candidatus Poribacteria bacterium]